MPNRSGKFYRKNEARIMKKLGLKPTKGSGCGWVEKEDGQSENVICQLKSTDHKSISFKLQDFETLEYNANVAHKIPLFALQFIESDDVFILMRPSDLKDLAAHCNGEAFEHPKTFAEIFKNIQDVMPNQLPDGMIRTAASARDAYNKEYEKQFEKERKSAL